MKYRIIPTKYGLDAYKIQYRRWYSPIWINLYYSQNDPLDMCKKYVEHMEEQPLYYRSRRST